MTEVPTTDSPLYAERTDVPTEEPTRLGDALPLDEDGQIVEDAPHRLMPGFRSVEPVASVLAKDPDSPEAEVAAHGAVGVSDSIIGAAPVVSPIGENVPHREYEPDTTPSPHAPPAPGSDEAYLGQSTSGDAAE